MAAVGDRAEHIGIENQQLAGAVKRCIFELYLPARDRTDIAVTELVGTLERVIARIFRHETRGKMRGKPLRQVALAGRLRPGQANAERSSDFFHSIHPITARPRKEAYSALLA